MKNYSFNSSTIWRFFRFWRIVTECVYPLFKWDLCSDHSDTFFAYSHPDPAKLFTNIQLYYYYRLHIWNCFWRWQALDFSKLLCFLHPWWLQWNCQMHVQTLTAQGSLNIIHGINCRENKFNLIKFNLKINLGARDGGCGGRGGGSVGALMVSVPHVTIPIWVVIVVINVYAILLQLFHKKNRCISLQMNYCTFSPKSQS